MPILIRFIAQRVLLIVLSSLSVVGLSTQTKIEADQPKEESPIVFKEEKEILENITFPIPKKNILSIPKITEIKIVPITKLPTLEVSKPTLPKTETQNPFLIIPPTLEKTPVVVEEKIIEERAIEKKPEIKITPTKKPADTSSISSIENVLVNIQCVRQSGNKTSLTNGSGVIISSSGVVLTNSHVAQNFLLKDAGFNCTIRRENIPLYGFTAKPLYISESWIEKNYQQIGSSVPTGTGEYDYALLLITGTTNPTAQLPRFPDLKINVTNEFMDSGDKITVAGYPGIFSSSFEIAKNTTLKTDNVTIKNIFTLAKNSVDVVGTSDTIVAQRGSSGGGAFKDNELGGIIVSTNTGSNASKSVLNIITLSYINRAIKNETGKNLSSFVSGNLMLQVEDFATVAPHLTELLMRNL